MILLIHLSKHLWTAVSMWEARKKKRVKLGCWGAGQAKGPIRDTATAPRHRASWTVVSTMCSAPGKAPRTPGNAPKRLNHLPSFYCGFWFSNHRVSPAHKRHGFPAVLYFLFQRVATQMQSYRGCLQRVILQKHLLETQDAMMLKMEKYKIFKWFSLKWMCKLWNQE